MTGDLGPYDPEAMLFMDYRTSYVTDSTRIKQLETAPTFMYAMPLGRVGDPPFSPSQSAPNGAALKSSNTRGR